MPFRLITPSRQCREHLRSTCWARTCELVPQARDRLSGNAPLSIALARVPHGLEHRQLRIRTTSSRRCPAAVGFLRRIESARGSRAGSRAEPPASARPGRPDSRRSATIARADAWWWPSGISVVWRSVGVARSRRAYASCRRAAEQRVDPHRWVRAQAWCPRLASGFARTCGAARRCRPCDSRLVRVRFRTGCERG